MIAIEVGTNPSLVTVCKNIFLVVNDTGKIPFFLYEMPNFNDI